MAIGTGGNPNRQRMINLMYIVFIAMMALNISPEVLVGFSLVERELRETTESLEEQNRLRTDLIRPRSLYGSSELRSYVPRPKASTPYSSTSRER